MGVCINRYVGNNEKSQCLDEERDHSKVQPTESKDKKLQITNQIPMVDNALERDVPTTSYPAVKLPKYLAAADSANYEKLYLSLLSGLPNEQEFALNVCAILSNDEDNIIRLERIPKLVDVLVAQTGIWPDENDLLKLMYMECWDGLKGRNMHRFWRSTLDLQNKQLVQLTGLDLGEYDPHADLLNLESDQGAINAEGQRVLMVSLILHNLSFEKSNVPFLVRRSVFIRFLLLSIHSSWSNLRQTAYDTLANIAYSIELQIEKDSCSRLLFQTVIEGLLSPDRFMSLRSMDILSQLCGLEVNEDIIPSHLDFEMYQQMVSFLTVHDIMLLFYALEALYALSDLGKYACDKISSVQGSIGILVSLLTLQPSQYGPSAEIKMKIVEILVPSEGCDKVVNSEVRTLAAPSVTVPEKPVIAQQASIIVQPSPSKDHHMPVKDVSSETFASNWLKANYEYCAGSTIPRNDLYVEYITFSTKAGRKAVMNANAFAHCVKTTYPLCDYLKVQSLSGVVTFHHNGLKKKNANNSQIIIAPPKIITTTTTCNPNQQKILPKPNITCNASPILKAQLSAPTITTDNSTSTLKQALCQPATPQRPKNHIVPVCTTAAQPINVQASQVFTSVVQAAPIAQTSTTLIKSLLANKVQQRNVSVGQRLIVPQSGLQKMVIISPGNLGTGSPNAVMRMVMPSQMNIRASPIQARTIGNKSCIVATANPMLSSTLLQSKVIQQPQTVIAAAPASSIGAHVNGLKVEPVETQAALTGTGDVAHTQVIQVNCAQNHLAANSLNISNDGKLSQSLKVEPAENSDVKVKTDQNFIISNIQGNTVTYRLAAPHEIPVTNSRLYVRSQTTSDGVLSSEQNGPAIVVNSKNPGGSLSLVTQSVIQPKVISSPANTHKAAFSEVSENTANEVLLKQLQRKEDIAKRSPLLNGLLDKGKPSMKGDILFNALVENGIEASDCGLELPESPPPVQSTTTKVMPVSAPVNSFILPSSSLNSVIVPTSSLTSAILPFSSSNSVFTSSSPGVSFLSNHGGVLQFRTAGGQSILTSAGGQSILTSAGGQSILTSAGGQSILTPAGQSILANAEGQSVLQSVNLPISTAGSIMATSAGGSPVTFLSNGANVVQIRTGQTTFSGTAEVQPDQKGVVRLHIESPENSNQGSSDLSSITDITRTLESASEAISRTNAECATQVPQSTACSTTTISTVISTNTPTVARQNQQQIIVVTPSLNQSQLNLQSPNIKFCILHTVPVGSGEEPMDIVGLPQINLSQLNQLQQQHSAENPSIPTISLKRPSSEVAPMCIVNVKKPRIEPVHSTVQTITTATPGASGVVKAAAEVAIKPALTEVVKLAPKVIQQTTTVVQSADQPGEKEKVVPAPTVISQPQKVASPPVQPKVPAKLEYLCEWKNCGLTFSKPGCVLIHASKVHTPDTTEDLICKWEGCDSMKRKRFSLLTHLQDWHCNEKVLKMQALRRQQIDQQGQSTMGAPPKPPPHPGYAPDAALLAIKRHALQYVNPKELSEEKESALTKSIRLTSALILRNLVTHSSLARTYLRRYEPELAYLAMSPVESAKAIAQCLSHLSGSSD